MGLLAKARDKPELEAHTQFLYGIMEGVCKPR